MYRGAIWASLTVVVYCATSGAADDKPAVSNEVVIVKVVDEAGKPVAGARVGTMFYNTGKGSDPKVFKLDLLGDERAEAATTDEAGVAVVPRRQLFWLEHDDKRPIIATTGDRSRIGIVVHSPKDVGKELTITIRETRSVVLYPYCAELVKAGREVGWSGAYAYLDGVPLIESATGTWDRNRVAEPHQLLLPAGKYSFRVYGANTYHALPELDVGTDREYSLTVDLPASQLALLEGKPAPEFQEIKGWYGSEPLTMAGLKGKVVLLDFWGYWCGPCVDQNSIGKLFELHDKYHERGLVIIGVHDDSVKDAAELEEKLAPLIEKNWEGRRIPFPVAIDGGGEREVKGRHNPVQGATTAAYGTPGWPTYVLIDREGTVRGKFFPNRPEQIQLLEDLLEATPGAPK